MSQATLLDLRRRHGRTVRTMGIDQAHYVAIEHGRRSPGPRALQKMATSLGLECSEVWDACLATQAATPGAKKAEGKKAAGRAHGARRSKRGVA